MNLWERIPLLQDLRNYSLQKLYGDLFAGLTVGVMLIPQGMAIAVIAGLPPLYGLYAALVPLVLYSFLGTSRQMAVGPVALVAFLVYAGLSTNYDPGSEAYISRVLLLSCMIGVILFITGVFRLGYLANFLSGPVISGFTTALALVIILVQLKTLLGLDSSSSYGPFQIVGEIIAQIRYVHIESTILGLSGLLFMIFFRKISKAIPWGLIAIVIAIVVVKSLQLNERGLKILGDVPSGLPVFSFDFLAYSALYELFPLALTIAIISFVGSISMAKAIHERHKDYKLVPNQELIAFGFANIAGSFFQSLPVAGGLSRTAVNSDSGAKSGVAGLLSALIIAMTLIFLTPAFYYLPKTMLAAIIISAAIGLVDFKTARELWKTDRMDAWMLIITFLGTLILGVQEGIFIGVSLSLGTVIYKTSRPHMAILGKIGDSNIYKNISRFEEAEMDPEVLVFRFDDRLYFANVNALKDTLGPLLESSDNVIKLFILDAQSMSDVDSSGVKAMFDILRFCEKNDICFTLTSVIGPVRDKLFRSGFVAELGQDHFHERVHEAIAWFNSSDKNRTATHQVTFQTNLKK